MQNSLYQINEKTKTSNYCLDCSFGSFSNARNTCKQQVDAKKKAEFVLGSLDQKITGVKSVSLSEFGVPYPQSMFRTEAAYATAETGFSLFAPTPVFSSEQDVSTSAHVVFLIGDNN